MGKTRRALLLLLLPAAVLALALAGCAEKQLPESAQEEDVQEQPGLIRPSPGDPEYSAYILSPDFWGKGVILEGNPEMGFLLVGFNVPAGTSLYAPFDGVTGAVSLEDYSSDKSDSYEGRSLCAPGSLNGISAYNVAGTVDGAVKAGDIFAEVASEEHIFPKYYGKVNLIFEFNLFDSDAADYTEMRAFFEKIFDHLLKDGTGGSR